MDPQLLVIKG
jgi:hypothetical protein